MTLLDLSRILGIPGPCAFPLCISYADMYPTVGNIPGGGIGPQIDMPIGYVQQYTLDLQHQITSNLMVQAAYIGTTGINLNRLTTTNQEHVTGPLAGFQDDPRFAFFIQEASEATSSYQSLFLRVEKRLSQGLMFVSSYTFSKSIDTVSSARENGGAPTRPQDSFNLDGERGLSNFDVRHRFITSFTYDLPWGPGRPWGNNVTGAAAKLLEGWQVGGILTFQSGQPFTPQFPGGSNAGFRFPRPSRDCDPNLSPSDRDPAQWFDASCFFAPPVAAFAPNLTFAPGNAGRNTLEGPGIKNVDFSIMKSTSIGERYNVQFRAEFFNISNHPNFNLPDRVFVPDPSCQFLGNNNCRNINPNFGKITSAKLPRVIQFGVKFTF